MINKIKKIKHDFNKCNIRANRIGIDCLELHIAHEYFFASIFS